MLHGSSYNPKVGMGVTLPEEGKTVIYGVTFLAGGLASYRRLLDIFRERHFDMPSVAVPIVMIHRQAIAASQLTCLQLYRPLCYTDKNWGQVGRQHGLRCRRPVAQGAVRSDEVLGLTELLGQHFHLQHCVEDLSDQQLVSRHLLAQ